MKRQLSYFLLSILKHLFISPQSYHMTFNFICCVTFHLPISLTFFFLSNRQQAFFSLHLTPPTQMLRCSPSLRHWLLPLSLPHKQTLFEIVPTLFDRSHPLLNDPNSDPTNSINNNSDSYHKSLYSYSQLLDLVLILV